MFGFGSLLAHAQQDGHDENSLGCVMSLGGHRTVRVCFGGTSARVVQHHQQNPQGWSAGAKSLCLGWVPNSSSGVLHGPETETVFPVPLSAVTVTVCSGWSAPTRAKGCLEGELVRGDLVGTAMQMDFPQSFLFNVVFAWVTAFVMRSLFPHSIRLERWILCVRNLDARKYEIFCRETEIPRKYLSGCKFFSGEFSF